MSSPELERFEITGDDVANEFNPNRKRFKLSKNKAIYGVWADDSDDEGNSRPSFGGGSRKDKRNYTAPMSFISGGIKVGDKTTKQEAGDVDDDNFSDSDGEFDRAKFSSEEIKKSSGGQKSSSSVGSRFLKHQKATDVGTWEKHTKGIGQKLMEKMGYRSGSGLGKNLQGIQTPVEAFKRKGKAAIGFYGSERSERSLVDFPVEQTEEEAEEEDFKQQLHQWKKPDGEKKKKPKYIYKTADEIIASGGRKKKLIQSELSKVKVIDMTGKEKRVLSGYHALSHRHENPDEEPDDGEELRGSTEGKTRVFDMPELLHNLDLLVDMAEDEILQNNKKLQYERDLVVNLKHESEKLNEMCVSEESQIQKVKDILDIVSKCESRMAPGSTDPMNLDECARLFKMLQENYYEEYKVYDLASLAVALVFPLMKAEFAGWQPLQERERCVDTVLEWRSLLEDANRQFSQGHGFMEPYERLIWEIWMPHVRSAINIGWSARNPEPLIAMLELWVPMIPEWIASNITEQLVLPRLQKEVDEWNPLTDTMPIHAWLHPWLPLMQKSLEPLYAPIRHKLANALTNWHPSDPSAKMILQPWLTVWLQGHLDAFLVKNIAPKLGIVLQEFTINPHQQHLDAWNWVMSWLDMLPHACMVVILEKHFFPRWQKVLSSWLSANPNYEEVTKWYTGWKSIVPDQLHANPAIKDQFNRALSVMNRAVSGHFQPGARENVAYLTSTERRRQVEAEAAREKREYEAISAKSNTAVNTVPVSFKELLERKAEENGIVFVPIPNRTREAKQVYRFGTQQIYIDRGVIFVCEQSNWAPVSLLNLVNKSLCN